MSAKIRNKIWNQFFRRTLKRMTKGCAYDVNKCCVELEAGNWNVRWAGVSVRWKRECSLVEAWEFVEEAGRRWRVVKNRRWLVWRIVRRAEEGIETSSETWRSVRLNVAERAVERGGACGWTWRVVRLNVRYSLCFTVVDTISRFIVSNWLVNEHVWRAVKSRKTAERYKK